MSSVAGKVVVITGAGRGIGRGIAIAYGRDEVFTAIERTVQEFDTASPGNESRLSSYEGARRKDHQHEFGSGAGRRGRNVGAAYTALSPSK
jgi:NAD(P)-dependent dehydrogenase (short-subunit alcohol dehydrogenase family)